MELVTAADREEVEGEEAPPGLGGVRGKSPSVRACPLKIEIGAARGVDLVDELSRDDSAGDVLICSALACRVKGKDVSPKCERLDWRT